MVVPGLITIGFLIGLVVLGILLQLNFSNRKFNITKAKMDNVIVKIISNLGFRF